MTRRALLLLVPAVLGLAAPAQADYFTVHLDMRDTVGDVATAVCTATAETSARGYVAVQTTVTCRIQDSSVSTRAAGPRAAAAVAAPVPPSYLVCVSGTASFVSVGGGRVLATAPEQCAAIDH